MIKLILNSRCAVLLALCAVMFSVVGCSDDDSDSTSERPLARKRTISTASIVDAASLVIVGDTDAKTRGSEESAPTTLYKILESGEMASVAFKDKEGKEITIRPDFVHSLSEKYVYMDIAAYYDTIPGGKLLGEYEDYWSDYPKGDTIAERLSLVVRKEDGAVFSFPRKMIEKDTKFQTDYNQNVYFYSSGDERGIYKMYNYAGGVDVMKIIPDYYREWLVDQQGNVAYSESSDNYMCRLAAGEYARFADLSKDPFIIKTESQNFYFLYSGGSRYDAATKSYIYEYNLHCYKPKSPTMEETISVIECDLDIRFHFSYAYYISLNDKTIVFSGYNYSECDGIAVFYSQDDCKMFEIKDKLTGKAMRWNGEKQVYSNKAAYNFDKLGNLRMLDFETGEVSTVYQNTEYQISSINVATEGNRDVITFSAMELRTGNDVVVEVRDGKATVLNKENKQKIIQLERIN